MRASIIAVLFISLVANSCKKQELATNNPMIGKWKLKKLVIVDKCSVSPSNPYFTSQIDYVKVEMEISVSGDISFEFEDELEKLRITKIEKNLVNLTFNDNISVTTEYKCKVKNRKGKAFIFRFYTNGTPNKIYGTYWTPNHPYFTPDMPNYASVDCSWGSVKNGLYYDEYFALYDKI